MKNRHALLLQAAWFCLVLATFCARALAQQDVGTVASTEGSVEIGRAGVWSAATIGRGIRLGDEVRTGRPGRVTLAFQDESVLNVGDDSHVTINDQVFAPDQGAFRSAFRLLRGKVRALVSEYYQQPGASYQIETPTAVSGVRGTEFILSYDADLDTTEVVGISGRVEVHGLIDRAKHGVFITAQEFTGIVAGRVPAVPRRLDDLRFRQYLDGLTFIGGGQRESVAASHPAVSGSTVPPSDTASALPAPPAGAETRGASAPGSDRVLRDMPDASNLVHQPPARLSSGGLGVHF